MSLTDRDIKLLEKIITPLKLIDYEDRLVGGDLTGDGVQFSDEKTTGVADTDIEVLAKTIEPGIAGNLLWGEFGLTAAFRATTTTADLVWKWQARNKGGTWVDLHPAVTETDIGTSWVGRTRQGFAKIVANFNGVPFDVRLLLSCNEANAGKGRVKSSSYARAVFQAS